ncbi:hypothetical protein TCAL_08839 [Tigriopus californicus]|uniref:Uncharacterized protein n=2 Tax=Tigriopus californicus TaxID=6832 RepID=A0A553PQ88_TIGCA|nr:hypothetical protein TCAL_08839 [Tigriopus californicus]
MKNRQDRTKSQVIHSYLKAESERFNHVFFELDATIGTMKDKLVPMVLIPIFVLINVPNPTVDAIHCYDGRGNAYREVTCNTTVKWCSKVTKETEGEKPTTVRGCYYSIPENAEDSCEEKDESQNSKVVSCWCQGNICNNADCSKPLLIGISFLVVRLLVRNRYEWGCC